MRRMESLRVYLEKVRTHLRSKMGGTAQYSNLNEINRVWEKMKNHLVSVTSQAKEKGSDAFGSILAFIQVPDLLKWTESLTKLAATAYDKAMDVEYIRTGIGGAEHRLFDGGHTIIGSWQAASGALKDDTQAQEIISWAEAYIKDLTTTMGMPISTIDKPDFDRWVETVTGKIPGLDREYLYDLLSFDAMEICGAGLSVVGVFFALKKEDKEKLAEILGAMGISSIMAANPVLGITTIAVTAYSYWRHGPIDVVAALKGGGLTAISTVMFSIMGLPILVEFATVVVLTILLRKHIIDNQEFGIWLKAKTQESLSGAKELLNLQRVVSLLPSPREL